jgi:hypothetical protein
MSLEQFVKNRNAFPADELGRYTGQHVGMVQTQVTAQGWLGSTPEGRRPQVRGRAGGSLAVASSTPATPLLSPAKMRELNHAASRNPWCDTPGLGVYSRSAPGLCRIVAGDGCPVWPAFSPSGRFGRSSESRSPAAGRELAARRTIKPGGIRAHALSLTVPDPFLLDVTILPRPL